MHRERYQEAQRRLWRCHLLLGFCRYVAKNQAIYGLWVGEVVTRRAFTAFFCAKRRIGQQHIIITHAFAEIGKGVAQ